MVMHFISVLSLASITTIIYKILVFRRVKMDVNTFIGEVRKSLLVVPRSDQGVERRAGRIDTRRGTRDRAGE